MPRSYIALGSNQGDPVQQVQTACGALRELPRSQLVACSSLYRSAPMGPQDQPSYINAVLALDTELEPAALLDNLQRIELEHGRVRKAERWGPRTLDLDILLYGDQLIRTERLQIPHYHMHARAFVLYPLAEIAPALKMPDGTALETLLQNCPRGDLQALPFFIQRPGAQTDLTPPG